MKLKQSIYYQLSDFRWPIVVYYCAVIALHAVLWVADHIGPGSMVTHKAFGTGKVTVIEKGVITVSFDGLEKKFQFPGAFQQGFLRETR